MHKVVESHGNPKVKIPIDKSLRAEAKSWIPVIKNIWANSATATII